MSERGRRWLPGRVSFRFALVLALALLPLGLVSFWQTRMLNSEVQARAEAALVGEVLGAASGQVGMIQRARGMLAVMSKAVLLVIDDDEACSNLMLTHMADMPQASVIAYVQRSGIMSCTSTRKFNFAGDPLFEEVVAIRTPYFFVNRAAPVSGTSILGITHPVFSTAGDFTGYVIIALPHHRLPALDLNVRDTQNQASKPFVDYFTYDRDGQILTSTTNLEMVSGQLPTNRALKELKPRRAIVFQDVSTNGVPLTYSVVPLVQGELFLMGSWKVERPQLLKRLGVQAFLAPVLMWAAGLIAAAAAAEWMVVRHLRDLRGSITRFAGGDRRHLQTLNLVSAPTEFQEIGEAYLGMTESIMMGEAKLEDSVHQKEVLLREVHHRVKNNLQLIASIMNMQIRKAQSPESRRLLKGLQDRVMSLATIHRGLYQTSGLVDVRADELLGDIARQIVNMSAGPGRRLDLVLALAEMRLTPDQAVPLSLLLTEAMTNAIKYSDFGADTSSRIEVRLARDGTDSATLDVVNDIGPVDDEPIGSTGLGQPLLTAFAQQLGGSLTIEADDSRYRLSVRFVVQALDAQAEEAAEEEAEV